MSLGYSVSSCCTEIYMKSFLFHWSNFQRLIFEGISIDSWAHVLPPPASAPYPGKAALSELEESSLALNLLKKLILDLKWGFHLWTPLNLLFTPESSPWPFPYLQSSGLYTVFISGTSRREQQVRAVDKDCTHAWLCAYPGTPGSSWLEFNLGQCQDLDLFLRVFHSL